MQVNIDWKGQNFGDRISDVQINMKFVKLDKKEYSLASMEIVSLKLGGRSMPNAVIQAQTINGYSVRYCTINHIIKDGHWCNHMTSLCLQGSVGSVLGMWLPRNVSTQGLGP